MSPKVAVEVEKKQNVSGARHRTLISITTWVLGGYTRMCPTCSTGRVQACDNTAVKNRVPGYPRVNGYPRVIRNIPDSI